MRPPNMRVLVPCSLLPLCVQCALMRIGGLFEGGDLVERAAFQYTVHKWNEADPAVHWQSVVVTINNITDPNETYHKTCELLGQSVLAVFGPTRQPALSQVQSLCDAKEVPHVMPVARQQLLVSAAHRRQQHSVNLYPPPQHVGRAVADAILYYDWTVLTLFYQYDADLLDLQPVLELSTEDGEPLRIGISKLPDEEQEPDRLANLLRQLKRAHVGRATHKILLHADLPATKRFLRHADDADMLGAKYHYIFTNFDTWTLDVGREVNEATRVDCNMTSVGFVHWTDEQQRAFTDDFHAYQEAQLPNDEHVFLYDAQIPITFALMTDSVGLLAVSALEMHQSTEVRPMPLKCDDERSSWADGSSFLNWMKMTSANGTTGRVELNNAGQRNRYQMLILEYEQRRRTFTQLATWAPLTGMNLTKAYLLPITSASDSDLHKKTLRVTVYLEEPFVMYKESEKTLFGNDQYEGYSIDLLDAIAQILGFNYTIQIVKDSAYGSVDADGNWNGMVGELVRKEADMVVASLTMNFGRSEVIDFTVPFMHLGISILCETPKKKEPELFSFLSPFSSNVWMLMMAGFMASSFFLWVIAKLEPAAPDDGTDANSTASDKEYTLCGSIWFMFGSLVMQGGDTQQQPQSLGGRIGTVCWWFFSLLLVQAYTANLAAALTIEKLVSSIESVDDLVGQTRIQYGTLGRGSTMSFFKESRLDIYQRMWEYMSEAEPSVFVNSTLEGIDRVKQGDYCYLMESTMLEYYVERDCELRQVGGILDSKGYGIGLQKDSPYREPISGALLMLQEKTKLAQLKVKWWKQKRGGGKCSGQKSGGISELSLRNVGGVFVVLGVGMGLSLVIAVCEFFYHSRKHAILRHRSVLGTVWSELQFAMSCFAEKKPAIGRKKSHRSRGEADNQEESQNFQLLSESDGAAGGPQQPDLVAGSPSDQPVYAMHTLDAY